MDELKKLTELCARLGAPPVQADAMARQLIKRTDQLASERGQTREEAMAYLLRLLVQGRNGTVPPEFQTNAPPPTDLPRA
jgi:hypothetical protein